MIQFGVSQCGNLRSRGNKPGGSATLRNCSSIELEFSGSDTASGGIKGGNQKRMKKFRRAAF